MKTLDLTLVGFCTEKREELTIKIELAKRMELVKEREEIAKRNQRAKAYSDSIKAKKMHNLKENLIALATIICVNATVLYTLVDALL